MAFRRNEARRPKGRGFHSSKRNPATDIHGLKTAVLRWRDRPRFLISACLAGINCTYNAKNNLIPAMRKLFLSGDCLLVCPEVMGGLPVPRPRAEIVGGDGLDVLHGKAKVINVLGKDVTGECVRGAAIALRLANKYGIKKAILKAGSPCCGKGRIYNGHFNGVLKKGSGVLTSAFMARKIKVYSEKDFRK